MQYEGRTSNKLQHSSLEKAIRSLAMASQAGQLPGAMYGRLHTVMRVKSPGSVQPVNAVLHELCRMVRIFAGCYSLEVACELPDVRRASTCFMDAASAADPCVW